MVERIVILLAFCLASATAVAETEPQVNGDQSVQSVASAMERSPLGQAVERQLPADEQYRQWVQDESAYETEQGDRIEVQKVLGKQVETVKLQNIIPPIRFESGKADIPDSYIAMLRDVLDRMKHRTNVRLHFIGHTDNVQLSGALKEKYGDNAGLSRERAGTTAEYFQRVLDLPPESISYEGAGESKPVASNATAAGRAKNRRVEVEVWYDEITEKLVEKEVLVSEELNRVKVCRVETVCKISYKEGHAKRARLKNLIPPLHFDEETTGIPAEFLQQIRQGLHNLRDKQNVVVKFIGHTDNIPLSGREARIYGTHVGLSKARARRVSLAVKDAMGLPTSAVDSDGKGAQFPVASNETAQGRALNRRVEVEYWYDDPLQELSDQPQLCPESAGAETVTRVYDPPSGSIKPIYIRDGKPDVTPGYAARLGRIMDELKDKSNVRLRFLGYTSNERLDRRTALVYGDDIGLSAARARRAMEAVKQALSLADEQAEHEGRGYIQSDDVVNSGFVESDTSRVDVQVVYDELAAIDDADGMEVTRFNREVQTQAPYALNLMRITVDGKPVSDPGKSIPDVQRCTDVAFSQADIQFKFDNLGLKPRLNITAWPNSVRFRDDEATEFPENLVQFKVYTNYSGAIDRYEVRLYEQEESVRDTPLAVVEVNSDGLAEWQADFDSYAAPGLELKYVVRAYDAKDNFDQTEPQPLWVVDQLSAEIQEHEANRELLAGYGESRLAIKNIPLSGGTIKVHGSGIPSDRFVFVAGRPVPVDEEGSFVVEEIIPSGLHTVEVAVLDQAGNGELFLRDLEFERNDWFYVGIADVTLSRDSTNGPAAIVTNDRTHYDNDLSIDGRIAFYTKGKFADDWKLTASADTREEPIEDLFSNFTAKTPDSLFRRIDPDYYYPTYGDDSTVEEDAPTLGKFYLKVENGENYGLWGSFKIGYVGNDLAHVDRSLYGANLHYQSQRATSFGEERFGFDAFAAEPGTVASREEFRGTGGSLYYLKHQDILIGSDRVRIEIRDKDSGIVVAVKNLIPALDYDIDYLQGRILLSEPLSGIAADDLLVDSGSGSGNPAYLVVRYEFTPGFDEIDTLATGGRTHFWLGDYFKVGLTAEKSEEAGSEHTLNAADLTLRKSAQSWLKLQLSQSEGVGTLALDSADGGFSFDDPVWIDGESHKASAHRIDGTVAFSEFIDGAGGSLSLYQQSLEAGYSAPGLSTLTDTEKYGGTLRMPLTDSIGLKAKSDHRLQDQGLEARATELDLAYRVNDHWQLSTGARQDSRIDHSPVVPATQEQGERSDLLLQVDYDSRRDWSAYGFVQDTVETTGNREENGRVGAGGAYRVTERFRVNGEVSDGDLGSAARIGTDYLYSDRTNLYLNYILENERADNGVRARKGSLVSGFKTHYSDSASVYVEERYTHGDTPTGLTHSTGVDLAPTDRLNFGANVDVGTLRDPETGAETRRKAYGVRLGYGYDALKIASALEYLVDESEATDGSLSERKTWLTKNSLKYQLTPDWRLIGKLNYSESTSSLGEFYDGTYTEAVLGYGYRPVSNDRLNVLAKYTYFYNVPTTEQVTVANTAVEFIQKSHIASLDVLYDVTRSWTLGAKYAYRLGQVSLERENPEFFDNRAHLYVLRADWHFIHRWDTLIEGRLLDLPDAEDRRSGALVGLYRHVGENVKMGIGYNFTDFSDDLTDLSYDSQGVFINLVGKI